MNNFQLAYQTDIGIRKKTNQDSLLLKGASVDGEELLLAVLCDGMGGMSKGELASATAVRFFNEWFMNTYVRNDTAYSIEDIQGQWIQLLEDANLKLIQYGDEHHIQLGTTATAILIFSNGNYLIGHVGDTRVYQITDIIRQLTEDHTFTAREIGRGNMTEEQAEKDSRKNILLQCIGVNQQFLPQFVSGCFSTGDEIVLCSDGFRHVVTKNELLEHLKNCNTGSEKDMKMALTELVELNKKRNETDNISVILIRLV